MGTKNPQRPRRAATPRVIRLAAEPAPEITPTVEIVTGQPLPAEKAAAVSAKPKWTKKTDAPAKPKKTSMLDAAAVILGKAKAPVHTRELIDAMLAANLWKSPAGRAPWATLDAAIRREIRVKAAGSSFAIAGRGLFQTASN